MKRALISAMSLLLLLSATAFAQPGEQAPNPPPASAPPQPPPPDAIDLAELIRRAAEETGKEIIYSRAVPVNAPVVSSTAGEDADYETLLTALRAIGFFAIESDDQIRILPDAQARSEPSRVLQNDDRRTSDHEIVTRVITVDELPTAQLIPILRPMLPQFAQLGAVQGTNKLIIVDRYDNVRRITEVIDEIVDGLKSD